MIARLRQQIEDALEALDPLQFEHLARHLLSGEYVIEPIGSPTSGITDGGRDFRARPKADREWVYVGQAYHPVARASTPLGKRVLRKARETRRDTRRSGVATGRQLLVTSGRLDAKTRKDIEHASQEDRTDLILLDRSWVVEQLERREHAWLRVDYLDIPTEAGLARPRRYLASLAQAAPGRDAALTAWTGRQRESEDLRRAIATHDVILVTGMGGIGKSRLLGETALIDEADLGGRRWFFLEPSATAGGSWHLALPAAMESVLGMDDPLRNLDLLRKAIDLLQDKDGPRCRLALAARPDCLQDIRGLMPPNLSVGVLSLARLEDAAVDFILTSAPLRLANEAHRAWIIDRAEGNPQVAAVLALVHQPGTRANSMGKGLRELVVPALASVVAVEASARWVAFLSFVACFTQLPLFESALESPLLEGTDAIWSERHAAVTQQLRHVTGASSDAELTRLRDALLETGFLRRMASRHGVSLAVRPDIVAEALAFGQYFGSAEAAGRYAKDVAAFAHTMDLDREVTDRLAAIALTDDSPSGLARWAAARRAHASIEGIADVSHFERFSRLLDLERLAPAAPDVVLRATRAIIETPEALPDPIPGRELTFGSESTLHRVVKLLDALLSDDTTTALQQQEAVELLLALVESRSAGPGGTSHGDAATRLIDSVAPGESERSLADLAARLEQVAAWWRAEPGLRAGFFGRVLANAGRTRWMRSERVPAERDTVRLRELVLADVAEVEEHFSRVGRLLLELGTSGDPRRVVAAVRAADALALHAMQGGVGAGLRANVRSGFSQLVEQYLPDFASVPIATRVAMFETLCRMRLEPDPTTSALLAGWERLRSDSDVRLHRHLASGFRTFDDAGEATEPAWLGHEEDPVVAATVAACATAADAAALTRRLARIAADSACHGGGAPSIGRVGWLLARQAPTLAVTVFSASVAAGDPLLHSLAAGSLAGLWQFDADLAQALADGLRAESPQLVDAVLLPSLAGKLTPRAWDTLASIAATAEGERLPAVVAIFEQCNLPGGADASGTLLALAGRMPAQELPRCLELLAPPGGTGARMGPVPDGQRDDLAQALVRTVEDPSAAIDGVWLEKLLEWLARERPDALAGALIERLKATPTVRSLAAYNGRDGIPSCITDLPRDCNARRRLIDQAVAWLEAREHFYFDAARHLLLLLSAPGELASRCSAWLNLGTSRLRELAEVAPLLSRNEFMPLLAELAAHVPRREWAGLASMLREHVRPSGFVYSAHPSHLTLELLREARVFEMDHRASVRDFGQWMMKGFELDRRAEEDADRRR